MVKVSRQRDLDDTLTAQPGYALVGVVRVPEAQVSPIRAIWRRVAIALLALVVAMVTVYLGRAGYTDVRGVPLSFIDCALLRHDLLDHSRLRRPHPVLRIRPPD